MIVSVVAFFVLFAYALQSLERTYLGPLPGASLDKGELSKAAEKAIDLYVEIAKSLISYAIAALGGLAYLIQKDLEKGPVGAARRMALPAAIFLIMVASIFFGISGVQYIADSLSRYIAFATPLTVGLPLDDRFRRVLQVQYYSFIFGLALIAVEILGRLNRTFDQGEKR